MRGVPADSRSLVVVEAPSNLGLRPPRAGSVPGVYKLAGALRDEGLRHRLDARGDVVVTPGRYVDDWEPGDGVRNESEIARFSAKLADRIQSVRASGAWPLVLGGDCSILLGTMLGLRREGRHGLAFIDGHLDFRRPGNSKMVGAAAGEDLALVTGRGGRLAALEGDAQLVLERDVVAIGSRAGNEQAEEVVAAGISVLDADAFRGRGAKSAAAEALARLEHDDLAGFFIHFDVDAVDSAVMPAVDTPESDGLDWDEIVDLLSILLRSPAAIGLR